VQIAGPRPGHDEPGAVDASVESRGPGILKHERPGPTAQLGGDTLEPRNAGTDRSNRLGARPLNAECPSRAVIDLIADKWSILIVAAIDRGATRNGQLLRAVGGISQKALTRALRDLEHNGLVHRYDHQEIPPRVDYSLTDTGRSLAPVLATLCEWAIEHMDDVANARRPTPARRTR
jgi:DNA-binding HxlR family transcriptional regulator